ncbi:MAG: inorganic phosphate transporter [Candidatus Omnitrophica bacterium]|nr:inorganic phosphate transporter [Candidatus Omnitrophota bacterium]
MWVFGIFLAALFVAYANGANDNFKGVATLLGSGTTSYRKALVWATVTTLAGSLVSFLLATQLVKTFSGRGLVPDSVVHAPPFLVAVILGAALTVFLATKMGMPISTTHALTGALLGGGLITVGSELGFGVLGKNFFVPLLLSPIVSMILAIAVYPLLRRVRRVCGITKESCLCVGGRLLPIGTKVALGDSSFATTQVPIVDVVIGEASDCAQQSVEIYSGKFLGITAQRFLDFFHFLSAGAVSFARGMNDTPKIVALLVATSALGFQGGIVGVALAMAVGGLVSARKVAETISLRITQMNHGQGFTANAVTAFLVILASRWGMPVSTTHVSCGSLFGIGLVNGKADWKVIRGILAAWVLTLPVAAASSAILYVLFRRIAA